MKAHTAEKREIILSIGMIVKNEEKVLERCLKSLQPLMKAIPSELIIADTGSTDSTVEIAKKYTNNVFHFEWINDFAAARNSTLEKAKGEWYMFIDADEYLDSDIHEMIYFLKDRVLRNKYNTLEVVIRNYTNLENTEYVDAILPRLFNINQNIENKFNGSVHETMDVYLPIYYSSTILQHTGYVYNSTQQNYKKKMRNFELMENEYERNPQDLRIISHLIEGTGFDTEKQEKYILEALEIVRTNRDHVYSNSVYLQAISFYRNYKPEYGLKLSEEYICGLENADNYITTIGITLLKAHILMNLGRLDDSYNQYQHYFKLYEAYKNNQMNTHDISAHPIDGLTEHEFIQNKCLAASVLCKLLRYEEAINLIREYDLNKFNDIDFKILLSTIRNICQKSEQYTVLAKYHESVMNCDDDNRRYLALYMMESTYYSIAGDEKRKKFAETVVDSGIDTNYAKLMKLIIDQNKDGNIDAILDFIYSIEDWKDGFNEAIYLAIKYGIDISKAVDKMDASLFREKLETIAISHDDFAGYVLNYGVPEEYIQNIKRFYWITSLYEKSAYRSFELNDHQRYALYLKFVELLGEYVSNIYNPELLQDEFDVQVIPPLHKFGYYMLHANKALLNGDSIGYVKGMKKALQNCESMKEIVEFMLEQYKKKIGMN